MLRTVAILVLALVGCSQKHESTPEPPAGSAAQARTTRKDPEAARRLIASGAVVLDVRTPEEFAEGHLDRAVNIPVSEIEARLSEIDKLVGADKSRPVVTYCGSGARSAKAMQALERAGYTNVVNGGGYDDLQ